MQRQKIPGPRRRRHLCLPNLPLRSGLSRRGGWRHRKTQALEIPGQLGKGFLERNHVLGRLGGAVFDRGQTTGGQVGRKKLLHVAQVRQKWLKGDFGFVVLLADAVEAPRDFAPAGFAAAADVLVLDLA